MQKSDADALTCGYSFPFIMLMDFSVEKSSKPYGFETVTQLSVDQNM